MIKIQKKNSIEKEVIKEVLLKYSDYDGLDYMEKVWEELELDDEEKQ